MKKFVVLTLIFSVALLACSCSINNATVKYRNVEGGVALYRYSGVSTVDELRIPDTESDEPLVEIMEFAVANGVYLKRIYIGKNVERIHPRAFINCPELVGFIVDADNTHFKTDDRGVLYTIDGKELISFPNSCLDSGEYIVQDGVERIGDYAFYACTGLKKITFSNSVEYIGEGAFIKCENLTDFDLPLSLKTIGNDAFSYCNSLTRVEIPSAVTSVGDYAFYSQSTSIESIIVHNRESNVSFGKNWLPTKNGMNSGRVTPVFDN